MTKMTVVRPGVISPPRQPLLFFPPSEHDDEMPIASSRIGKARTTSMNRDRIVSTQPR